MQMTLLKLSLPAFVEPDEASPLNHHFIIAYYHHLITTSSPLNHRRRTHKPHLSTCMWRPNQKQPRVPYNVLNFPTKLPNAQQAVGCVSMHPPPGPPTFKQASLLSHTHKSQNSPTAEHKNMWEFQCRTSTSGQRLLALSNAPHKSCWQPHEGREAVRHGRLYSIIIHQRLGCYSPAM
jgi:hypothetical protein